MTKVGIINVTGYAGVELARLLMVYPEAQLVSVTGRSAAGERLSDVFPHLMDLDLPIVPELGEVDIAFSALPHKASAEAVLPLLKKGIRVVDISADFRLKKAEDYHKWYEFDHPAPQLLKEAVYGLPELKAAQVTRARLVANPGCYPTSAILALAPVIKEGIIQPDIIIDSKSGVSGAGRTLSFSSHYSEANENLCAYALEGHRHLPEIVQELQELNPRLALSVTFLPHLVPMTRGIMSSCYATIARGKLAVSEKGKKELLELYRSFYVSQPFVRVTDFPPQTKHTSGTNLCLIHPTIDLRTGRVIVLSCLDNLVKGAAGQAIQNMNLMLGLPETTGLKGAALYP